MNSSVRLLLATFVATLVLGGRADAQSTSTWANSNVTGTPVSLLDWFTGGANPQGTWTGGTPASNSATTIQFFENTTTALTNTAAPSSQTVNLNNGGSAFELGTLTLSGLGSATANANLTMTLSGDAINFSGATGTINLDALNNTRTVTYNVNNNIQLGTESSASALTIGGAGTGTFVLGGIISELQDGGGSLVKTGNSAVSLTGANTFSGGVAINAGTLRLGNAAALGTGTLTIAGGSLDATSAVTLNNNAQNWNGNFTFVGSNALNLGTGAVSLGAATRTVTVSANTLTVGGVISGGGAAVGLTKSGTGTLSLDAANTYTGVTTVSQGVLLLNNASALPGGLGATGGTSALTFNGGVVGLTSDFSRSIGTSASQVQWSTGGGGFAAYGADRTVNLGGNATPSTITWGNTAANGGFNGQTLSLGAAAATHTVELVNPIDLGSTNRTITVGNGAAAVDVKISGNLAGSSTLTANGGGTLLLSGSNSFGGLSIQTPVIVNSANALGSGAVTLSNLTSLASQTAITVTNPVNVGSSGVTFGNAAATGNLVLSGGFSINGATIGLVGLSSVNITGTVSGAGGTFNLDAGKTLRLGSDNSGWTGTKTLNGPGTYILGHAKALGTGTISLGGSNSGRQYAVIESDVDLTGANALTNPFIVDRITGGFDLLVGGGFAGSNSIELAGDVLFTIRPRGLTNYISGGSLIISGSVTAATSAETSTATLIGTGNTTISGNMVNGGGTLALTVQSTGITTLSGSNSYTGATSFTGQGRAGLVLDYSTQNNSKLSDTAALTLNGVATVVIKGGSHTETVLSTSISNGGTVISRDGGSSVLQLNAITRGSQSTLAFGESSIATTDTLNVNGILGGWATIGNDWAINSTNGADGAITALSSYTGALPTATGATIANYTLTGDQTQTGAVSANTVKITNTGNSETLSLGGNNLTLTNLGGILYAGGGDGNYTIASTTGRIQSGNSELIFQANSGTLTVDALVGANNATSPVTKSGAGTLVLGAANNFTGAVRVNQGALRLTNATAAGTTAGGITVQNGAALELTNNISVGAEALTLNGSGISNAGALRNLSGPNTYGGLVTLAQNARINSDAGTLNLTNAGTITGAGFGLTIGGAGNTSVSSIIGTGAGTLTKDGAGTLTLSAASTYTGHTTVSAGTLALVGAGSINSSGLTVDGGHLRYDSSVAYSNAFTFTRGSIGGTNLTGSLGGLIIGTDRTLSPGMSPGIAATTSQFWDGGGTYLWEINDPIGTAGGAAGWDLLTGTGSLTIMADSTDRFTVAIRSLNLANAPGFLVDFDPVQDYAWKIADFANPISTFSADAFAVNTSGFVDSFNGAFSVALGTSVTGGTDNQLYMVYTAVPEPGTVGLIAAAAGLTIAGSVRAGRARRQRSAGRAVRA